MPDIFVFISLINIVLFFNRCNSSRLTNINGTFDASPYYGYGLPTKNTSFVVPAVFSHPHFLHGDPDLFTNVTGFKPSEDEDSFYIDVHAVSKVCKQYR